jgi:hypothetical protein
MGQIASQFKSLFWLTEEANDAKGVDKDPPCAYDFSIEVFWCCYTEHSPSSWAHACWVCVDSNDAGVLMRRPDATVAVTRRHIIYNFLHERRPGNFFERRSCKTALSKLRSANSFLNRVFSAETYFS